MANFETLLSPSGILLYGRLLSDLEFNYRPPTDQEPQPNQDDPPPRLGDNKFLQKQLEAGDARLARIYGFSYEGHYYDLARPAIFLVHGPGTDPEGPRPGQARVSRAPADADRTGIAGRAASFSEDVKVWSYDKADYSLRFEVDTGPLEQILLEAEMRSDRPRGYYSGADMRIAGADMRISGADMRIRRNRNGD
jgi:hypothetical protein